MYFLIFGFACISVCHSIHLPGIEAVTDAERQKDIFEDIPSIVPNFRSGIPSSSAEAIEEILPLSLYSALQKQSPATTTPNPISYTTTRKADPIPLANLLNRIFGDDRWQTLLKLTTLSAPKSTTSSPQESPPPQRIASEKEPFHGFQDNQISAGSLLALVTGKDWGNHKDVSKEDDGQNYQSQGIASNGPFQPSSEIPNTPPPSQSMDALKQLAQYFGGNVKPPSSSGWLSSGGSLFNPDKVNSQARMYNPNAAFDSFITQTGSSKDNSALHSSYNADKINQRYMQNGAFPNPPGFVQSGQTANQNHHSYGGYGSARVFDADALNQALMNRVFNAPKGNAQTGSQYSNGFHPFQKLPQSQSSKPETIVQTPEMQQHKETVQQPVVHVASHDSSNSSFITSNTQVEKANKQFNFIPGRLSSSGGTLTLSDFAPAQQYSKPSFLSSSEQSKTEPVFDPNALNAAQAMFNPNAISWIKPRSEPQLFPISGLEDEGIDSNTSVILNKTDTKSSSSITTLPTTLGNSDKTPEPNRNTESSVSGFDPNIINSQQGQSNFVPGQITPHFFDGSGYGSNLGNKQGSFASYVTPDNPKSNFAPGMNFDIQSLLGIGTTHTNSSGETFHPNVNGVGLGGEIGSFSPNAMNINFANILRNDSNNGNSLTSSWGGMTGQGMSFGGGGFDPNAVNTPGFGAFPSNSVDTNYSASGYTGSFGGYPTMNGGGFGSGIYDANVVNQNFIHKPFGEGKSNATGTGMGYFLGIGNGGYSTGQGTSFQSAFISDFDPSSVNQAVYDPNKYNTAHINFDPLEMLSKNPGMDKATLGSASFDPDKANTEYTQINLSPLGMISSSLGINKTVLNSATFDPSSVGQASFIPSQIGIQNNQLSGNQSSHNQPSFDPVETMRQLMKDSNSFLPGTSGSQQMNFDPSILFQQGSQIGPTVTSIPKSLDTTTQLPSEPTTKVQTTTTLRQTPTASPLTTILTTPSLTSNTTRHTDIP